MAERAAVVNNNNNNNIDDNSLRPAKHPISSSAKWHRDENARKLARNKGEAYFRKELNFTNRLTLQKYVMRKAQMIEAKVPQRLLNCCSKKCYEKFTDDSISELGADFRQSGSLHEQRMFIARYVSKEDNGANNARLRSKIIYTLPCRYALPNYRPLAGLSLSSVRVCKKFFMAVLQVGRNFIDYNLGKKIKKDGLLVEPDRRKASRTGRNVVSKATIRSIVLFVREKLELYDLVVFLLILLFHLIFFCSFLPQGTQPLSTEAHRA